MSVRLSIQDYCGRQALVTHSLGERLMIRALIVHFITELSEGDAVLALLVWFMLSLALRFDVREESFEALMFNE